MNDYVLGTSDHELTRLEMQHGVWREVTARFLDALGIRPGSRVVDLGCGPGPVVAMLRERVGPEGRVLGIDASERWIGHLEERVRREGWGEVEARRASIEELELEGGQDLIFMRWVLAFLPEPGRVLERLARSLAPGGAIAVMDYNHEGVSLFPRSEGFRAAVRGARDLYATRGGDAFLMGSITGLFRRAGLETFVLEPYGLMGGPDSPVFGWASEFFTYHAPGMVEAGVLSEQDCRRFLAEWAERAANPDTLFFSPYVVGAAGRRR